MDFTFLNSEPDSERWAQGRPRRDIILARVISELDCLALWPVNWAPPIAQQDWTQQDRPGGEAEKVALGPVASGLSTGWGTCPGYLILGSHDKT